MEGEKGRCRPYDTPSPTCQHRHCCTASNIHAHSTLLPRSLRVGRGGHCIEVEGGWRAQTRQGALQTTRWHVASTRLTVAVDEGELGAPLAAGIEVRSCRFAGWGFGVACSRQGTEIGLGLTRRRLLAVRRVLTATAAGSRYLHTEVRSTRFTRRTRCSQYGGQWSGREGRATRAGTSVRALGVWVA